MLRREQQCHAEKEIRTKNKNSLTSSSSEDFSVEPNEGSISKTPIDFIVRYKPTHPTEQHATLVIETEDWKMTYDFTGKV